MEHLSRQQTMYYNRLIKFKTMCVDRFMFSHMESVIDIINSSMVVKSVRNLIIANIVQQSDYRFFHTVTQIPINRFDRGQRTTPSEAIQQNVCLSFYIEKNVKVSPGSHEIGFLSSRKSSLKLTSWSAMFLKTKSSIMHAGVLTENFGLVILYKKFY